MNKIKFESFTPKILAQIDKSDLIARRKAAVHLARRMRKNIGKKGRSSPGEFPGKYTGNLRKGIGVKTTQKRDVLVGSKAPHSHLLEDGHEPNKTQTKRPFFKRSFKEEKNAMIDIMSKKWF